ncbi:hypothetical protein MB46_15405 [Arthrobacter alpinus]|nr:hypothetical protein MB46_15405 [Arthrobacter alpinus]
MKSFHNSSLFNSTSSYKSILKNRAILWITRAFYRSNGQEIFQELLHFAENGDNSRTAPQDTPSSRLGPVFGARHADPDPSLGMGGKAKAAPSHSGRMPLLLVTADKP